MRIRTPGKGAADVEQEISPIYNISSETVYYKECIAPLGVVFLLYTISHSETTLLLLLHASAYRSVCGVL